MSLHALSRCTENTMWKDSVNLRSLPIRIFPWRTWRFYCYGESFDFTSLHWFRPRISVHSFIVFTRACSFTCSFIPLLLHSRILQIILSLNHLLIPAHFSFIYLFFLGYLSFNLFCFRSLVHSFICSVIHFIQWYLPHSNSAKWAWYRNHINIRLSGD